MKTNLLQKVRGMEREGDLFCGSSCKSAFSIIFDPTFIPCTGGGAERERGGEGGSVAAPLTTFQCGKY